MGPQSPTYATAQSSATSKSKQIWQVTPAAASYTPIAQVPERVKQIDHHCTKECCSWARKVETMLLRKALLAGVSGKTKQLQLIVAPYMSSSKDTGKPCGEPMARYVHHVAANPNRKLGA